MVRYILDNDNLTLGDTKEHDIYQERAYFSLFCDVCFISKS